MRILLACLPLLAASCFLSESTINQELDPQKVAAIEPGVTTALEVAAALGAPDEVVQLTNRSAWHYQHLHEKQSALFLIVFAARGVDTQVDRVWVFFDEDDVVTHVGSSFRADQAEFGLPPK